MPKNKNCIACVSARYRLFGETEDVRRLHEEADDSGDGGENLLRRWPTTKGYFYKPDGLPLSCSASRHAYDIFNRILDEADQYHVTSTAAAASGGGRTVNNTSGRYQSTRLSTFYTGRKRKVRS